MPQLVHRPLHQLGPNGPEPISPDGPTDFIGPLYARCGWGDCQTMVPQQSRYGIAGRRRSIQTVDGRRFLCAEHTAEADDIEWDAKCEAWS